MPNFFFVPSARLQTLLARELIADPNVAVLEFVKNAYDAGASNAQVSFQLQDRARSEQELAIFDDGVGMNESEFEQNWMHPGYSQKAQTAAPKRNRRHAGASPAEERQRSRIPVGEKGLGRLAAGRLGDEMEVFTRRSTQDQWLHVAIRWDDFDDMDVALTKVPVPYNLVRAAPEGSAEVGTTIVVRGLTQNWAGFIPGRKVAGRSDSRLGRLQDDLRILLLPLSSAGTDFQVAISVDTPFLATRYAGIVKPAKLAAYDYRYDFSIGRNQHLKVARTIRRSSEIAAEVNRPKVERQSARIPPDEADRPASLNSGPFKGTFLYLPRAASRLHQLGVPPGVFVYRDGLRVDPYGYEGDDWLGARARKASRQGWAAIQPKYLFGHVQITKASNPDLVDMSNRQGLVENEAEEDFVGHARAEFSEFERIVLDEYVEPKWESLEKKEQRAAERATTFSAMIVRTLLHSLRQSTAGLGAEMASLSSIARREKDLSAPLRKRMETVVGRAQDHIKNIDDTLDRTIGYYERHRRESVGRLVVGEILDDVVERVRPIAERNHTAVSITGDRRAATTFERTALLEALSELTRNAIEAPRDDGISPVVELSASQSDGKVRLVVTDNGRGVPLGVRAGLFVDSVSTKGRPGGGLVQVRELLALYGGDCALTETSQAGSSFAVTVPAAGGPS